MSLGKATHKHSLPSNCLDSATTLLKIAPAGNSLSLKMVKVSQFLKFERAKMCLYTVADLFAEVQNL